MDRVNWGVFWYLAAIGLFVLLIVAALLEL